MKTRINYTNRTKAARQPVARFVGGLAIFALLFILPAARAQDRDDHDADHDHDRDRMTRIEPGTTIAIRTTDAIDSDRRDDQVYRAIVDQDVRGTNDRLAIPRGSSVELIVRVTPDNDLILDLESVSAPDPRTVIVRWKRPYFLATQTLLAALPMRSLRDHRDRASGCGVAEVQRKLE